MHQISVFIRTYHSMVYTSGGIDGWIFICIHFSVSAPLWLPVILPTKNYFFLIHEFSDQKLKTRNTKLLKVN